MRYRVYAFDISVRAAFLDAARGFFNGTSVCLRVHGREGEPHAPGARRPAGGLGRRHARCARADAGTPQHATSRADYDELVDHPVELGRFWRGSFDAAGVPHEFVVAGALPDFDGERLLADTQRICETEIALLARRGAAGAVRALRVPAQRARRRPRRPRAPRQHRAGRAAARPAARAARPTTSDGYGDVLGLITHEYFHAWNVKRLKPREFAPLDYTRENYTELLWFFEGFTSYYDDLLRACAAA